MRRHQIVREELRQRRKHLECLMAEHQRRVGLGESPQRGDNQEGLAASSQPISRDERWEMEPWPTRTANPVRSLVFSLVYVSFTPVFFNATYLGLFRCTQN